ncbi:MAG TPA: Ig-like domain-containing protein [Thermoanaerobaculia bacterium]|jgi:RHS repeat-associated protein|nr:Ig-like domain-containing protein [Thermoanaerobaculia bacterium]
MTKRRFPSLQALSLFAVLALLAIPVGKAQNPPDTDPPQIHVLESGADLTDGRLFNRAATPVIQTTDASDVTVNATLDGAPFTSGTPVSGEGTHLLSVTATDAAGNAATLAVGFEIDTTPPAFLALQPADDAILAAAQVTLQGQVAGANAVKVDGQPATLVGQDFTAGPYTLAEGVRSFAIVATDAAGNTAQRTLRLTRDSQAPTVAISQPPVGAILKDASVDVVGSAQDPQLAAVTVNGIAATVTGTTWLARQVPLAEGSNTLTARAEDRAGNAAQATRTLERDSTPPVLAITDPAPGTVVPGASITLRGTAGDAHLDRVEVNGVRASLSGSAWSLAMALTAGVNDFTVRAFDKVSNTSEATLSVTRDSQAPAVQITQPADGARLNAQTVTVSGTVDQEAGLTLTVNGVAATITGGTFSAAAVPLVEGSNTLIARVRDAVGNQGTHTRVVVRDTVAPKLDAADPASGALALPVDASFRLTFSEDMAEPAAGSWRLETGAGQAIPATANRAGSVLTVRPSVPLPSSAQVRLVLTAALTDLAGNALGQPPTLTFLTIDTTAPAAPVLDPAPPAALCAAALTLTGTAEAGAVVRVEGAAAAAEARADESGHFSLAVQLSPGSLNRLQVTATDGAGNVSAPALAAVVHDCQAPRVVSADRQGNVFHVVFSEPVTPASLAGAVQLSAASGPVAGAVALATNGLTATFTPSGSLPAGALRLEVTTAVQDPAGNALAYPWSQVFGAQGGSGFLLGTVIDNATGRPLAGARVLVTASNGTALPEPLPQQVTGEDGRFRLPVPAGTHDLTIVRPGYAPAFRLVASGAGQGTEIFDPRLTPAARPQTLGAAGGTWGSGGDAILTLPAGALAASVSVAATRLDEQGLPMPLPYGWSPRGAAWLDLGGVALLADATLSLPVESANGTTLVLVHLDLAALQWRVVGTTQVSGGRVTFTLPAAAAGLNDGGWAAVEADDGPLAPPAAVTGAVLGASARPAGNEATAATLTFNPEVVLPSQSSQVTAVYTLSQGVASGLPVTLFIQEELTLLDNSVRRQTPYQADLILYHAPDGTPRSRFQLRPSQAAQDLPLKLGAEDVTLRTYGGEAVAGNVVGAEGGTVTGDQGDRIDLPPGAVTEPTAIVVTRRTAADLGLAAPAGTELAGVVDLDLGGKSLLVPAALSLALSPAPGAGDKGLLLQVIDLDSGKAFRAVAALQATAAGWTTAAIDPTDLAWPGVRDEGLYAFVRLTAPAGYLRGTVFDVGGGPLAGAVVRGSDLGWLQISNANGTSVLPAPVATLTVTAENRVTGNLGTALATVPAADARVDLDITLVPVGPHVVAITPAAGAVDVPQGIQPTVRFSEAVDPASVSAATGSIQLLSEGQPVAVDLEVQGVLVRVTPRATLLPATTYELRVTSGVRDLQGNPLESPVASTFTTLRLLFSKDVDLTRIFLVAPDVTGQSRVLGRAGAVPANALVFVENRSALVTTPSATAGQDGSFDISIQAALTHTLILHVLIPNGNEVVAKLTPFRTADLKGAYVDDKAVTFTTGEGLTAAIPAGAFSGPTIVSVAARPVAPSPVLARDAFAAVAAFTLDFSGAEAHKALEISLPLPAGAPTPVGGFYLLNRVVEALGDHYWMMHDLMRLDAASGRLTTAEATAGAAAAPLQAGVAAVVASLDAPFALAAATTQPRAVTAAAIVPQHKQYVPGASFPGQYQVEAPLIPLGFAIFPVIEINSQVGVWNLGLEGIFTSMNGSIARLLEQDGVLIPTRLDRPSRFVVRDLETGYKLFDATLPPPTPETPVTLPPDVYGDKTPPWPVGGSPIRFFPVDVVIDGRQDLDRGLYAEVAAGRLTIKGEAGAAGDGVDVRLIGLDDSSQESATTGNDGAFTLTHSPGHDARRFLLAIGARVTNSQTFEVSFSEALDPDFTGIEVRDSHGRKLDVVKRPVGNQAVVRLEPKAGWRAKELYTLHLGPEMRDAIGNEWGKTLEIEFEAGASSPITTSPLASARDVARLGSLLFVAGDTAGLVVVDASDPGSLHVNGSYPFPLGDAVTAVAVDPHGRVLVAGGGVRAQGQLKIFDPLTNSFKGSTILSDALGAPGTQLPAGIPQRILVHSEDTTVGWKVGDPAPAGLTLEPAAVPTDESGEPEKEFTLVVRGTGTAKLPVTLQDLTAGRWTRVDAAIADGAFQLSLSVRPGDQLQLLRNTKSTAYVLTRGVGIETVDVNAFYNESGNRVLSDVVSIYSGFQDPKLRLCGEAVADLSTAVSDFAPLFDGNNINPLTLVGLVGFRGLVLLSSDPAGTVSFLNEACADVAGSRNVSGLLVLQQYAFDLNNDGQFTDDERRDYILVSHQQAGVLIYDATNRQNLVLVGRIRVPGTASRLGVDRDSHRLFVSALADGFYVVDLSRKPSVDFIDVNGDGIDDRILETVPLTGNVNVPVSVIPELGLGYVGGTSRGLTSVAVGHPEVEILARDAEGNERQVDRLAPFGVPTAPESSDPQAKNLPGSIRIVASLPGFTGDEAHLDVIAEDMGGFPIPEAGNPDTTEGLPRASWTGDHSMVLHRLATHPWEPGYERYATDDVAVITDLRASAAYKRSSEENDVCVRCDQQQEKVAKDALQLLSGDFIRIAFPQSLRDQLAAIYDRERLDAAEKRLTSVRWELSPAPKQETEQNPALTQAPGVLGHSGEITLSAVDLAIPGRGLDFVFQRTYRSQTVGSGTLGPGWDSNVYERLQELPNGDVAHFDGRGRRDVFKKEKNGDLTAPPGVFVTLEKVSTGWVMIDARHTTTRFDRFGRLISIADAVKDSKDTGNEMTFHYGPGRQLLRVHDPLDRDIRFEYDDKQRLKKITDFTDREFTFEYDTPGRLVKALTPPVVSVLAPDEVLVTQNGPLTTEYVYDDATGNLTKTLGARDNVKSVKDAKNQTWLQVNYAHADDDKAPQKVESTVWGGGTVGLQYGDNAATVTDALGHDFAYSFSTKGQITGIKDPANAEVHYTYDDEGLVTSRTDPLGRVTQYFYDSPCNGDPIGKRRSRGNLTHVVVTAGANGANGPSNSVETCTDYEPYSNQPVKVVDPRGIVTQISRTEVGLPERIEQGSGTPDASVTETHYNEFGQPILVFNPNHHATQYQYSNSDPSTGYLERITVDQGQGGLNLVTRFETDARGNVTRMIDPRGVGFTRVYNDLNWIVESRRASSSAVPDAPALDYVTTYFYDPNGNLSEVRLPYGDDGSTFTRVQYVYGARDELLGSARQVKPGDHGADWVKEYLFYDDALNLIKKIEPEGQTTRYVYDQRNLLSAMVEGYATPDAVTLGFGYDADGRRIAFSDGRQSVWTTAYDGFGRMKETRDPLGNRATVLYDNGSNPVETSVYQPPANVTDPPTLLARRSAEYDALNRVRSITAKLWAYDPLHPGLPDGAVSLVTQKVYDPASNLLSVTDPLGRVSRMEYDHAERRVATVDAAGNRMEYDLDPTGHPLVTRSIEQRPVGGAVTVTGRSSYDALGRLSSTMDGLGNTQRHTYDARNNLRLSIDAEGNVTERSYDGLDRMTRQVQPEGIAVDYSYDKSSRLISYRDALNQETGYTYDVLNRRKSVLYPAASTTRPQELYAYDANGNLQQVTDPNGTVVTQTFDTANRLTGRAVGPASGVLGPTAESFTHDGMGRTTHAQSGNIATDLTFDSLSRVTHERNAGRDLSFDYDGAGNALRVQYPSGFAVGQTFDGLNRPLSIGRANGAEVVSYGYRGADLVASKSLFNGLAGNRDYDAARRLLDETFRLANGQTVFRESLAWTPRSLKAAQSRGDLEKQGLILAYDGAERLTQAGKSPDPLALVANNHVVDPTAFNNLPDVFSYAYDKAQNLLARTETKYGAPQSVALPLDDSKRNRPAAIGGVALEWDTNGNLTRKGDLHFQYDYRNRLTRVTRGTGEEVATYQYDAFNRRIKKTVGSENRETAWRGWQPIEEYKNGGLDQRRVYGLGLDEIVQLQVDLDGNGDPEQTYAPLYDSTGNLVELTGNNGKPIERYEYTPYGQRKIFVDSTPPAVEQVRVKGNALVVELSEGISSDALAKVLTANTLTLTNLATQQPIGVMVTQPVLTGREARRRLLITITGPPAADTQVRLTIPAAALQDSFLNQPAQDFQLTFAWPAGDAVVQDDKPIQLQRVAVRDGFLEIELSEEPNLATTSAIQIDGASITWALGDDRYTLKSTNPLTIGSHVLAIGTALADLNGSALAQAFTANVSVAAHENLAVFEAPDPRETAASTTGNLFGFQGHLLDPETSLIYFRNRYYDPEIGRFITPDPVGYVDGPSLYAFVGNDPPNHGDPLGLYEADFHYGLTFFLARQAEYEMIDSKIVAMDDVGVDLHASTSPLVQAQRGSWAVVEKYHFPINPVTNSVVEGTERCANPAAWEKVDNATSLGALGIGLHTLQDSFSHEGASPGNLRSKMDLITGGQAGLWIYEHMLGKISKSEEGITHDFNEYNVKEYGAEAGIHSVDWTFTNPDKAIRAARATFDALIDYKVHTGEYDEKRAAEVRAKWASLVPAIREFAEAKTVEEKKAWLFKYQRQALGYMPWDDLSLPKDEAKETKETKETKESKDK